MPRPKLKPTEEECQLVKQCAAVGVPQEHIARKIGIRSPKTLRKYFREELDMGLIEANFMVAGALFKKAKEGNTDVQKFWLMNRAGWGRTPTAQTPAAPPPFVVARDESGPPNAAPSATQKDQTAPPSEKKP
jgi:hypothetical protein